VPKDGAQIVESGKKNTPSQRGFKKFDKVAQMTSERMRKALLAEVSEADLKRVVRSLIEAAATGNVRATAVLLDRLLGKPKNAPADSDERGLFSPEEIVAAASSPASVKPLAEMTVTERRAELIRRVHGRGNHAG
jgi:hypothetical protein